MSAGGEFLGESTSDFGNEDSNHCETSPEETKKPFGNLNEAIVIREEGGEVTSKGVGEDSAKNNHESERGRENPFAGREGGGEGFL